MSTERLETFELLVTGDAATGYSALIVESPAGEARSDLVFDPTDAELRDALAASAARDTDAGFLREVGQFLFEQLFQGPVEELLRSSLAIVRREEKALRVRLRFEAPELAALPWEYLFDPVEDHFLATLADAALVRYIPVRLPARPTTVKPPLRILVVVASPQELPVIEVDAELALVTTALREWTDQGRAQLTAVAHASYGDVAAAIRQEQPHIVHIVAHGHIHDDRAYLAFEDGAGHVELVDEARCQSLFDGATDTRLVVLSACQSATLSSTQPLAGLAPHLLGRRLSAVVAMQHPIPVDAARIFVRDFYQGLVLGAPVDAAVNGARRGIFLAVNGATPDWATPVLFLRAKDGNLFAVESPPADALEIPPPPAPVKPPVLPEFIGREAELADYGASLREHGIAVVAGMAGMGKSSLAAELATRWGYPAKTFWHTFHLDEGVETIIWKLAGFLAWHGRDELWKMLQSTALTGGTPPPPDVLFDYLMQLIRGQNYLICLDDFQRVDDDPLLDRLTDRLRPLLRAGEIRVILTSRRIPDFVQVTVAPLQGMTLADALRLLEARGIDLSEGLLEELYHRTEGNAELLTLAIEAIQHAADPARLLANLVEAGNVERYLLAEVDRELDDDNRQVMNGVAALLGYPGTRDVIEEVLGGISARRQLSYLVNRYLLRRNDEEHDVEYDQHSIVQAFYYDLLSRSQRQDMHRRAAKHYEVEENDALQAAIHYERADDVRKALDLAISNITAALNTGRAVAVLRLLERLESRAQSEQEHDQALILVRKGDLLAFLGFSARAIQAYENALTQLDQQDGSETQELRADVYLGMATAHLPKSAADALTWAQRGLDIAQMMNLPKEAYHHVIAGKALILLGKLADAHTQFDAALEHGSGDDRLLRAEILKNLGTIAFYTGDTSAAIAFDKQALTILAELNAVVEVAVVQCNYAGHLQTLSRFEEASETYQIALEAGRKTGNTRVQVLCMMGLGQTRLEQGNHLVAVKYLEQANVLAEDHDMQVYRVHILHTIAECQLRFGMIDKVEALLADACRIAKSTQYTGMKGAILSTRADLLVRQGDHDTAAAIAQQAIQLAAEIGEPREEAIANRILGSALIAKHELGAASLVLTRSLALLEQSDLVEIGRTLFQLGIKHEYSKNLDDALTNWRMAETHFIASGASTDLEQLYTYISAEELHNTKTQTEEDDK